MSLLEYPRHIHGDWWQLSERFIASERALSLAFGGNWFVRHLSPANPVTEVRDDAGKVLLSKADLRQ